MAKRSFNSFVEKELGKFPHFLIYAVLECVLIMMLFLDGFLAFAANEFAKFFELRLPCLLCTRIDHVLVHKDPDFYYNDSLCETHKKHISSLAYCHVHKKLSDIRKMCEACLLSFATEKESGDCDRYKSLVGILHKDLELLVDDDHEMQLTMPSHKKDEMVLKERSSIQYCSCCGETLNVKSHSKGKFAAGLSLTSHAPAPSPRTPFMTYRNEEARSLDTPRNLELPHIRYTELKFMSENESELPEDEGGSNALGLRQLREDTKAAGVPLPTDAEDFNEDKTPTFSRGNRFFGISLSDSAPNSPRLNTRTQRKSPLEKTDYGEGQVPSEAYGDTILLHLNRQVRFDRKSLMALYMELDEERNAAAVAANNAMAMITRLQAEKAALQMDALQYQRMMEEQAEYDQEALQQTKDMLARREEEIRDLEAELEVYREKYGLLGDEEIEGEEGKIDDNCQEFKSNFCSSNNENSECSSPHDGFTEVSYDGEGVIINEHDGPLLDENERRADDKLLRTKQMGQLKITDKKVQFATDDVIPFLRSSC